MFRIWCLCLSVLAASSAVAQEYSYDGNRWYDVEVSIFTNEVPGAAEIPVARKLTAAWLPRLRELQTRSSAFLIDFPEDQLLLAPAVPVLAPAPVGPETVLPETPPVLMGPIHSPAVRSGFKITDFDRDPFIDLDTRAAQFTSMNRDIDSAPEHRVLWHKVWRQPMEGRAQTSAVFVSGGDLHAGHSEIEGSLRLSDNAGGVMLDINVWLNRFAAGMPPAGSTSEEWKIPEVPFPPVMTAPDPTLWQLAEVWQLEQTRELGGNQLYYLDHPALGVLVQIRPYVLPPRLVAEDQEDF